MASHVYLILNRLRSMGNGFKRFRIEAVKARSALPIGFTNPAARETFRGIYLPNTVRSFPKDRVEVSEKEWGHMLVTVGRRRRFLTSAFGRSDIFLGGPAAMAITRSDRITHSPKQAPSLL
jgi:hypothetical protein